MDAAIKAIKRRECIRVAEAARNYLVDPTTLQRRMNGTQLSQADYAETRSILNQYEDSALLEWINNLSARGIPPTVAVVRNMIYEITDHWVGKNYVSSWVRRHADELALGYLRPINHVRSRANNFSQYKLFYNNLAKIISKYKI